MIRAPIPTRILRAGPNIRGHDPPHVRRQPCIRIIVINTDLARRRIPRHIRVDEREHVLAGGTVGAPYVGGTEQAAFFAGVEVEFERVPWGEAVAGEDAEGFEEDDDAGAVVVCAGAASGGGTARGVEVGADDNEVGAGAGDAGDEAGLGVGVAELGDGDGGVGGGDGFDLIEEPGA